MQLHPLFFILAPLLLPAITGLFVLTFDDLLYKPESANFWVFITRPFKMIWWFSNNVLRHPVQFVQSLTTSMSSFSYIFEPVLLGWIFTIGLVVVSALSVVLKLYGVIVFYAVLFTVLALYQAITLTVQYCSGSTGSFDSVQL